MHRTLSDSDNRRLVKGEPQSVAAKAVIVALMLCGAIEQVGAQPVETSQLPRKVLPNDPVGNLFNDGPRVVYTQEIGADPIEKLFWDRELKKEKHRHKIPPTDNQPTEVRVEPERQQTIKEDPKPVEPPGESVVEVAGDPKSEEVRGTATSETKKTETTYYQDKKQNPAKHSADSATPQPLKRAADEGKVDGVRINGAQWPVSARPKYTYGKQRADGRPWQGLVFDLPVGTHVKAIDAGRVMYANDFKNYGNLVIIDHGDRVASVYANNQRLLVKEGDMIGTGDLIALSGKSGSLDYPALYFEIRKEGKPVDPFQFLKRR